MAPLHQAIKTNNLHFTRWQEVIGKNIERWFEVFKAFFEIIRREYRKWDMQDVFWTTNMCVIIHNMLIIILEIGTTTAHEGVNIIEEPLV